MASLPFTRFFRRRPDNPNMSNPPPRPRPGLFANLGDDFQAAFLEFIGTTCFLTMAFGGVQAVSYQGATSEASSQIDTVLYISFCFGFSLIASAWLFYRVTGGLFNPNISLALLLTGLIGPVRFVLYCIAQLVGGITAAALILALTPGPLQANTFLHVGINPAQGVFIEAFVTAILVMSVLMLAAEKHVATPFAPIGIGLTLFVCHLFAVFYTGAGVNVARAFGPAVVTGFPFGSQWVYWVGDGLGSIFAAAFYTILKHLRYWKLNPGQDTINIHESPADPVEAVLGRSRSAVSADQRSRIESVNEKRRDPRSLDTNASSAGGTMVNEPSAGSATAGRVRGNDSVV